jgi:hypothetical protein
MKKVIHENRIYYYGVIILMLITMLWNFNLLINGSNRIIIHLALTIIPLILFVTKNKHSKMAIKIWSGIFFILAGGLLIFGPLLQILGNWMSGEQIPDKINVIIWGTANLLVGCIVFIGANKFILNNNLSEIEDE